MRVLLQTHLWQSPILTGSELWAQVIWVPKEKVPLMIRKSDGGYGYGTTDMAALRQRIHVCPWLPVSIPPPHACSAKQSPPIQLFITASAGSPACTRLFANVLSPSHTTHASRRSAGRL